MDYTQSNSFVVDAGTGFNRHEDNAAVPTAVTEKDMNSLIWSLMEVVKAGGQVGAQFDETVPATYKVLLKAMKAAFGGNVTTVNFANSPLVLTKDNAGLVIMDATAGNVSATLPAVNVIAQPLKFNFVRSDATSNTAAYSCAGADTFVGGGTSMSLAGQGDHRCIDGDAVSKWAITSAPASALAITAPVAANAMTLSVAAGTLSFRNAALANGKPNTRAFGPLSLVIPAGATLGATSGAAGRLIAIIIDNAGAPELAVVNAAGGVSLFETGLISTTAISAASAAANVVYSMTARANVPYRIAGYLDSTQAVAGQWATAPSAIQGNGALALAAMFSAGYGQSWQDMSASRSSGVTYTNTSGKSIDVSNQVTTNPSVASSITLVINGMQVAYKYTPAVAGAQLADTVYGRVPPGGTYSSVFSGATGVWSEYR